MKLSAFSTYRIALLTFLALGPTLSPAQQLGMSPANPLNLSENTATSSTVSGAKNLAGRFGLGIARLGPDEKPALSVDWQMSQASSLQVNLAIDHRKDNNNFLVDGLFSRNLFVEQHMHFFLYGGAGLLSEEVDSKNKSGLLLEAGAGGRFFFTGLPFLGFSFRGGVQLRSIDGTRFGTKAHVGAHYYF